MDTFDVSAYRHVTLSKKGDSHVLELPDAPILDVDVDIRCVGKEIRVDFLTQDGETIHFATVSDGFVRRLSGVRGIELSMFPEGTGSFWYKISVHEVRDAEVLDPIPVTETFEISPMDGIRQLVEFEIRKRLGHLIDTGAIDGDVDELVEEALNYDHEFEDEEDEFGTGYEEMEADFDEVEEKAPEIKDGQAAVERPKPEEPESAPPS